MTRDHVVRIMDLGVARLVEGSVEITAEGEFAGSLHYAAPEQFRSGPVGPGIDLYALGILFYELATGENPFRRDGAAETIAAHLDLHPPPLTERSAEVSRFISQLVRALLEEDPDRRFPSASAPRDTLLEGESSPWWTRTKRNLARTRGRIPRTAVRRETRLFGRETELAALREAWTEARSGRGSVLLIEG